MPPEFRFDSLVEEDYYLVVGQFTSFSLEGGFYPCRASWKIASSV